MERAGREGGKGYLVEYLPCRCEKSGGRVRWEMIRDSVGIGRMRGGSDGCHGEGKERRGQAAKAKPGLLSKSQVSSPSVP